MGGGTICEGGYQWASEVSSQWGDSSFGSSTKERSSPARLMLDAAA